jgi:ABC-type amino acid transport substrate-binding protein
LRGRRPELDAVLYSAEGGSAWTLIYPAYTVVIPHPMVQIMPAGYPVAKGDPEWVGFLSSWIELKKKDGTIGLLYDHWILGRGETSQLPRWSIMRDVLKWVE